jgi:hypothetical protein
LAVWLAETMNDLTQRRFRIKGAEIVEKLSLS